MSFQDLEDQLKKCFSKATKTRSSDAFLKRRVQYEALEAFKENKEQEVARVQGSSWSFFLRPSWVVGTGMAVVLAAFILPQTSFLHAKGQIVPQNGLVELQREGETLIVRRPMKLQPGDTIVVKSNAQARILLPNALASTVGADSQLRVVDEETLYVASGELLSTLWKDGSITTSRGIVRSDDPSRLRVAVLPSGETLVVLKESESEALVLDWNRGEQVLRVGDEVRLRTDTVLGNVEVPQDLALSLDQIVAIRSKLAIARTKAVNGLERFSLGKEKESLNDMASAQKTYKSIIQVLYSDRSLAITQRKNTELFENKDVVAMLQAKDIEQQVLREAQALDALFSLFEKNYQKEALFNEEFTGVTYFDRFRMVDRIFALGNENQKALGDILKQKYAVAFLQEVQNEELAIDQVSALNTAISLLPKTPTTQDFLQRVQGLFDPNLAKILEEKVNAMFAA